jgi:tRNA-(ms[2]io[6]A)-hydroxylase
MENPPINVGLQHRLPLRYATPMQWVEIVRDNFDEFLVDHADCERKASASAMSLVVRFADRKALVEPMISLAKEELQHFHEVFRLMNRRGLRVKTNTQDAYVKLLSSQVRHGDEEYFLDRLLVASLIEARSCERFALVAAALEDLELQQFYRRLAHEEAAHHTIFLKILARYFPMATIEGRLDQLLECEAKISSQLPLRPAMH